MTTQKIISISSRLFILGSIVLALLYIFLLNQTIMNGVSAHTVEKQLLDLNASVSEKEFEYIAIKNKIGIDYAKEYGFGEIKNAHYVTRTGDTTALSANIIR